MLYREEVSIKHSNVLLIDGRFLLMLEYDGGDVCIAQLPVSLAISSLFPTEF